MTAARIHFQERLDRVRGDVIRMGQDAHTMVRDALSCTLNHDPALAEQVIFADDAIDHLEQRILNETMLAVMQEAPVANDLRFLLASISVAAELEKISDDAVKLARRSSKIAGGLPGDLKAPLQELGEQASAQLFRAIRLYTEYDPQAAEELIRQDDEVDKLFKSGRKRIAELIGAQPEHTERYLRCTMCFHALEHVADHAAAIGERMRMVYEARQMPDF